MSNPAVPYSKPALAPADILVHLAGRGLAIANRPAALSALDRIGYFRLLIYMRPLQDAAKNFVPGTDFSDVIELYEFDRKLRLLCMDAIERIEVALRASIGNRLALAYGPHFYLESRHFESDGAHRDFFSKVMSAKYLAITHYYASYNQPSFPTIWASLEAVTLGTMSKLYSTLHLANRKVIAKDFGQDEEILVSWIRAINLLRNMCAHHNRLWNAKLVVDEPRRAKAVKHEMGTAGTFVARAAVLVALLQRIEPGSNWGQRLSALCAAHPMVDTTKMGFSPGWQQRPFWI